MLLLMPVALGSHGNSCPTKAVLGKTDVSSLAAAYAFDVRWTKVLCGKLTSSVAFDATTTPLPCPGLVADPGCSCAGLDTSEHLFKHMMIRSGFPNEIHRSWEESPRELQPQHRQICE